MMRLAYESEAAGLQIWEENEDPSHIEQNHALRHVVAVELPNLLLSDRAMDRFAEAGRQILSDIIREADGTAFGDIAIRVEQPEGSRTVAGGTLIVEGLYWPHVPGSDTEKEQYLARMQAAEQRSVAIRPGDIRVESGQPWPAPRIGTEGPEL